MGDSLGDLPRTISGRLSEAFLGHESDGAEAAARRGGRTISGGSLRRGTAFAVKR
jgi:hypothetical protein